MKYFFCIGSRPEIIKMSPLIKEAESRGLDYYVYNTGQHYDDSMCKQFYEEFGIEPSNSEHMLTVTRDLYGNIYDAIIRVNPDVVLVEGDTHSVMFGALAALRARKKIVHIEAGLRSGDMNMLEEHYRIAVDNMSDVLFAPTERAYTNIVTEGKRQKENVYCVGNTIVDVVTDVSEHFERSEELIFLTIHRAETIQDKGKMICLLNAIAKVQDKLQLPVIFPIHPHTWDMFSKHKIPMLEILKSVDYCEPLGYGATIKNILKSKIVLTDSGGLVEESCILNKRSVTLRESTERNEACSVGANVLGGFHSYRILKAVDTMLERKTDWRQPFGDVGVSKRIMNILENYGAEIMEKVHEEAKG